MFTRPASLAGAMLMTTFVAAPALSQPRTDTADPILVSIQDGSRHIRSIFTKAAEQMSDEDYAYRPTPDVRSFGELLAHVAGTSYWFCATALGEAAPAANLEKTRTTKAEIRSALLESLDYCDRAYSAMADSAKAAAPRQFNGTQRTALVVLNFRNYHSLLHWGNAITYMRLRGKVPPST